MHLTSEPTIVIGQFYLHTIIILNKCLLNIHSVFFVYASWHIKRVKLEANIDNSANHIIYCIAP